MQRVKVRLDTQKDVAEFVKIADTIEEDVYLVDNTYNRVNGKSLMGCLYSLEFSELYVESNYEGLSNKFKNFLL